MLTQHPYLFLLQAQEGGEALGGDAAVVLADDQDIVLHYPQPACQSKLVLYKELMLGY